MTGDPFLVGVNVPWFAYGEFGANRWNPEGGFHRRRDLADIRVRFEALARIGITALRWFVFCDGRAGIETDAKGLASGADAYALRDFDMALEVAGSSGLQLVPVLFDFLWCARPQVVNGVMIGGRFRQWRDHRRRQALLERVVRPFLARYGGDPRILAWDVLNEPEWITRGAGARRWWRTLGFEDMRAWIGDLVDSVHACTNHLATVGTASVRGLPLVRGLGVDVYQPHWYEHLEHRAPLATALTAANLDKPAWLGEFPSASCSRSVESVIEIARRAGYAGAFVWSLRASDRFSDFAAAEPALRRIAPPASTRRA